MPFTSVNGVFKRWKFKKLTHGEGIYAFYLDDQEIGLCYSMPRHTWTAIISMSKINGPRTVHGFATRNDAAAYMIKNAITNGW
jgi:hypothetical protein